MPLTELDPQTALIVVDPQLGIVGSQFQAYEQGFNVTLAIDIMTDVRPEAHTYSVVYVFPQPGETNTTRQVIDLLAARSL